MTEYSIVKRTILPYSFSKNSVELVIHYPTDDVILTKLVMKSTMVLNEESDNLAK